MRQRSFGRPRAVARASDPVLSAAGSRGVFLEPLEAPRRSAAAECVALRPLATPERDRGPARGVLVSDHEVPPGRYAERNDRDLLLESVHMVPLHQEVDAAI